MQVFGGVDGVAFEVGNGGTDAVTVFYPAQLFERFGFFEGRGRKCGDGPQNVAAVGVEADVFIIGVPSLPLFPGHAAQEGNGAAAEIESVACGGEHYFGGVFVEDVFGGGEGFDEGGDLGVGIVETAPDLFELPGGDKGFVALDVYDDVEGLSGDAFCGGEGFGATVGAGSMSGGGHDDAPAEGMYGVFDTVVVGGDVTRLAEYGGAALVNAADHGFAVYVGQRLAGKTARCVPGRNQC